MDRLEEAALSAFARHETFHPRYGWFRKGVKAAAETPDVFTKDSAPVELGVGKNMVRAIRFWGRAAKVLADTINPSRPRLPFTVPSYNGLALFDDEEGLDPYLERPGTLWLLHWWLLSPRSILPVWWLAFNRFEPIEFSEEDLLNFVTDELDRTSWEMPVAASVKKDVDCVLRMYAPHVSDRFGLDDILDCPFRELGIIEVVRGEKRRYRFMLGPKLTLPPPILAYACFDFIARTDSTARTATLSRLIYDPCSPGRIFRLTEKALVDLLISYADTHPVLQIMSTAGMPQLAFGEDPGQLATQAVVSYYRPSQFQDDKPVRFGSEPVTSHPVLPELEAAGATGRP